MNNNLLLNDKKMNDIINKILEIFNDIEGVELVRLNGLTKYLNKLYGFISKEDVRLIIQKLKSAKIINYKYKLICPHCDEESYLLIFNDNKKLKMCDTCKTFYDLLEGYSLFKI